MVLDFGSEFEKATDKLKEDIEERFSGKKADKNIWLGEKCIGVTQDEKVYVTYKKPEHYFRIFQGFGISESVLDLLEEKGIDIILMVYQNSETNKKIIYLSVVKQYRDSMNVWNNEISGKRDVQKVISVSQMIILKEEILKNA